MKDRFMNLLKKYWYVYLYLIICFFAFGFMAIKLYDFSIQLMERAQQEIDENIDEEEMNNDTNEERINEYDYEEEYSLKSFISDDNVANYYTSSISDDYMSNSLILFKDNTFKFYNYDNVYYPNYDDNYKYVSANYTGTYTKTNTKITLKIADNECVFNITNSRISTRCPLFYSHLYDSDTIGIYGKSVKAVLFDSTSNEYEKLETALLNDVNKRKQITEGPLEELEDAEVNEISDCYEIENKGIVCSVTYSVKLANGDPNKSNWLIPNGIIIDNYIEKFHLVTFTEKNNNYIFVEESTGR